MRLLLVYRAIRTQSVPGNKFAWDTFVVLGFYVPGTRKKMTKSGKTSHHITHPASTCLILITINLISYTKSNVKLLINIFFCYANRRQLI
jgi:hypothetical protein